MKTRKVYNTPGHAHGLTFCCYHGLPLLSKDRTRGWMIESMQKIRQQHAVDLLAFVLMPEHVHLLVRPRNPAYDMADIQKSLKQSVARKALAWLREHDPAFLSRLKGERAGQRVRHHFWQPGGGYDRNIFEPATLQHAVHYIHQNPVRRGLVTVAEDWRWSSARFFARLDNVPIEMDPIPL